VFVLLQISGQKDEGSSTSKFCKGDVVKIMGVADREEEEEVAGIGKVVNLEGDKLQGVAIPEGCVYVEVQKSNLDEYLLYCSVDLDDPPITKMGQAVGSFILWPTQFLKHPCALN
jgi:hypothetical protein